MEIAVEKATQKNAHEFAWFELGEAITVTMVLKDIGAAAPAITADGSTAGVTTTYRNYEGVTHEFFGMGLVVPEAEAAEDFAAHDLKAAFSQTRAKG